MPALVLLLSRSTSAQIVRDSVPELDSIDVVEHLGQPIPLDLQFTDDQGRAVTLGDYFQDGRPVVMILGYYRCPMLCNLVFNGLTDAVADLDLGMGGDYTIITVSINPQETSELAAAKKNNYLEQIGPRGSADGWAFLIGDESQSAALAEALGFQYYYVEERDEYAHPAVVFLLTEDGVISRYLYGVQFGSRDLRFGLLEASEGKIGSTVDRILLYCFHYDPDAGGYVLFARNVMTLGGAATVVLLGALLIVLWTRERYRRTRPQVQTGHPTVAG